MYGRRYQRKRGFRRTLVLLLTLVMLAGVCFPGLRASAEGETADVEVKAGEKAEYSVSGQIGDFSVFPNDGGLVCNKEDGKIVVDATSATPGTYKVAYVSGSDSDFGIEVTFTVLVFPAAEPEAQSEESEPAVTEDDETDAADPSEETTASTEETVTDPSEETSAATEETVTDPAEETTAATEETVEGASAEGIDLLGYIGDTPDLTIKNGESKTTKLSYTFSGGFTYTVKPASGITVTNSGRQVTISVGDDVVAGAYEIECSYNSRYGNKTETIYVQVPLQEPSEGDSGLGTGPVTESQKLNIGKTATARGDGTYDLELTISGSVGSQTNPQKMDVIFIVDNSNSMYPSYFNYMTSTKAAMNSFVDSLERNENIDARYAIATFGTKGEIRQGFGDGQTTKGGISAIGKYSNGSNGGTNYQYGIYLGKQLVNQKREGAITVVIFLSDGVPTFRGITTSGGNGQNDSDGKNIDAAVSEAGGLNCNYFYAIGLGSSYGSNLNRVASAVNAPDGKSVFSAGEDAAAAFQNIVGNVTKFLCSNVTITDNLSKSSDGKLLVEVTDLNTVMVEIVTPENTYGPAASVTLPATSTNNSVVLRPTYNNGVLQLDFPDDYQLEENYTYKLKAVIKPTEDAYKLYRDNNGYPNTGAAGTGTHAGQGGIFSNGSATASYTFNGVAGTANYPAPVVQLMPGKLTITKRIDGIIPSPQPDMTFNVNLTYGKDTNIEVSDSKSLKLSDFTYNAETDLYIYELPIWSYKTAYSVTETTYTPDDYVLTTMVNGQLTDTASGTIDWKENENVAYVNTYAEAGTSVTISKVVEGNMGDWNKNFNFMVTLTGGSMKPGTYSENAETGSVAYTVAESGTEINFQLRHGQKVILLDVPTTASLTVKESGVESYSVKINGTEYKTESSNAASAQSGEIKVAKDMVITVVNYHQASIDTGIFTDTAPYIILFSVAAVGAAVLLTKKRRYQV